jgi:splicing factor 3A subunit 3
LLQEEIKSMRTSDISAFYQAVHKATEYYATFPNANSGFYEDISVHVDVNFSGEEIFGKYLDLNALHLEFSNIIRKANIEQDYLQYLDRFNKFFYLPDNVRQSRHYAEYLDHLWAYLVDFFKRTNPLSDWGKVEADIRNSFTASAAGATNGANGAHAKAPQPLRLGMFNTVEELEALGMERLKEGLEALGLKCGGTLRDRAARLFSVRGKKPEDIPANLRAKKPASGASAAADEDGKNGEPTSVRWSHTVLLLCPCLF